MTLTQKIEQAQHTLQQLRQLDREISNELHERKKLAGKLSRVELTNKQAAALLGKSVSTVQLLIAP